MSAVEKLLSAGEREVYADGEFFDHAARLDVVEADILTISAC